MKHVQHPRQTLDNTYTELLTQARPWAFPPRIATSSFMLSHLSIADFKMTFLLRLFLLPPTSTSQGQNQDTNKTGDRCQVSLISFMFGRLTFCKRFIANDFFLILKEAAQGQNRNRKKWPTNPYFHKQRREGFHSQIWLGFAGEVSILPSWKRSSRR